MKNSKKSIPLLILLLSVLVFSMVGVTAAGSCTSQVYQTADDNIGAETKYKQASTNRITFDANGGKIGSKKTVAINIRKGAMIKKFPATPKRTDYTFQGWYTKKSGGKRISVNTKPTKSVTFYAQWKRKSPSLSATEKRLVGTWTNRTIGISNRYSDTYSFRDDKTYNRVYTITSFNVGTGRITGIYETNYKGRWSVSGGTIHLTNRQSRTNSMDKDYWRSDPNISLKLHNFGTDENGQHFVIGEANRKYYKS